MPTLSPTRLLNPALAVLRRHLEVALAFRQARRGTSSLCLLPLLGSSRSDKTNPFCALLSVSGSNSSSCAAATPLVAGTAGLDATSVHLVDSFQRRQVWLHRRSQSREWSQPFGRIAASSGADQTLLHPGFSLGSRASFVERASQPLQQGRRPPTPWTSPIHCLLPFLRLVLSRRLDVRPGHGELRLKHLSAKVPVCKRQNRHDAFWRAPCPRLRPD